MTLMRIVPVSSLVVVLALLSGCASGPTVAELRTDVKSATFVQHGREPLNYKLGIVDGTSFWAKGTQNIAAPIAVPAGAATVAAANIALNAGVGVARSVEAGRAPTVPEMMSKLFNRHPMVNDASHALMPKLADKWGVVYDRGRVRQLQADAKLENEAGHFTAFKPTTDLVLVFAVSELEITEKPSVGGAFSAMVTAGFNAKDVSTSTWATMTAYKRDVASGQYQRVWSTRCTAPILAINVSFPFPELMQSPEKAKRLWDATTPKLIEYCSQIIERHA